MLASKGVALLRTARLLAKNQHQLKEIAARNHGTWNYRASEPPSKTIQTIATGIQGVAWWWILWHIFTEPDHITGEFAYPRPEKWTNAELGIPE